MRYWQILFSLLAFPALAADRVMIPAGSFQMGCSRLDAQCGNDEGSPGGVAVMVPAFLIDRHEVSVADYRRCVTDGACSPPLTHARNKYCNYGAADRADHPVNCVDWDQAATYCGWADGRLPTEAEWEKAARAGVDNGYPWPWGSQVGCAQAVLDAVSPAASDQEPDGCYRDSTWPVGSRPANGFGLHDMHGNAGEWVANWYAPDALTRLYAKGDLYGPVSSRQRVVRGGSWDESRTNLRSSFRNVKPPQQGQAIYGSVGFRCAADAP